MECWMYLLRYIIKAICAHAPVHVHSPHTHTHIYTHTYETVHHTYTHIYTHTYKTVLFIFTTLIHTHIYPHKPITTNRTTRRSSSCFRRTGTTTWRFSTPPPQECNWVCFFCVCMYVYILFECESLYIYKIWVWECVSGWWPALPSHPPTHTYIHV